MDKFHIVKKNIQVSAKENTAMLNNIAKSCKKKNYEVETIKGANHHFQKCSTCLPQEYGELEETLNDAFLISLKNYLKKTYL